MSSRRPRLLRFQFESKPLCRKTLSPPAVVTRFGSITLAMPMESPDYCSCRMQLTCGSTAVRKPAIVRKTAIVGKTATCTQMHELPPRAAHSTDLCLHGCRSLLAMPAGDRQKTVRLRKTAIVTKRHDRRWRLPHATGVPRARDDSRSTDQSE